MNSLKDFCANKTVCNGKETVIIEEVENRRET